jgi:hypothetical protein
MLCARPQIVYGQPVPCRKCMNCLINRKRRWAARIMLESMSWKSTLSAFVTLTYNVLQVPYTEDFIPTLRKADAQNFLRRLRNETGYRFRYFLVGEYGSRTKRPHYHLIIWGVPLDVLMTAVPKCWSVDRRTVEYKERATEYGFTQVGPLLKGGESYVANYVTKKYNNDPEPEGCEPEFTTMSRRPGLGRHMVWELAKVYRKEGGLRVLEEQGDVGKVFRYKGRVWPLDDYMVKALREELGVPLLAVDRPKRPRREITPDEQKKAEEQEDWQRRKQKAHGHI